MNAFMTIVDTPLLCPQMSQKILPSILLILHCCKKPNLLKAERQLLSSYTMDVKAAPSKNSTVAAAAQVVVCFVFVKLYSVMSVLL